MKKLLLGLILALGLVSLSACGSTYYGGGYGHYHSSHVVHVYHSSHPVIIHHYSTTHVYHHTTVIHHYSSRSTSRPRVSLTKHR